MLRNLGDEPVFSEFSVTNPEQETTYRVAIRGTGPGENFCTCPDFATNELGTCKQVEFTLGRLERKRGGKKALQAGSPLPYSEVYLRYGSERSVHFRKGRECPPQIERSAARLFDIRHDWRLPADKFGRLDNFLTRACKTGHEVRCYDDALDFIARARDAEHAAR